MRNPSRDRSNIFPLGRRSEKGLARNPGSTLALYSGVLCMSKIRINELARELEVKPSVILDLLPELGVTDKKTHSSSLDDDVVLNLRRRVAGMGAEEQAASHEAAPRHEPARQSAVAVEEPPAVSKSAPPSAPPEPARPTVSAPVENSEAPAPVRPAFPLRPPLATGQPSSPSAPVNRGPVIPSRSAPPPPRPRPNSFRDRASLSRP